MSIDSDAIDFLNQTGGKSCKFEDVGAVNRGTIISASKRQQTDLKSGELKFWDDGNPMYHLVISIQTDERDEDDASDDGVRNIYAKGKMLNAIQDAVRASGSGMDVGGILSVKYTGDGEPTKRGFNPPKLYSAKYEPPIAKAVVADLDEF